MLTAAVIPLLIFLVFSSCLGCILFTACGEVNILKFLICYIWAFGWCFFNRDSVLATCDAVFVIWFILHLCQPKFLAANEYEIAQEKQRGGLFIESLFEVFDDCCVYKDTTQLLIANNNNNNSVATGSVARSMSPLPNLDPLPSRSSSIQVENH